jgi:DNA-directed RNA polymerase subunit RPC12/RpoP
LTSDAGIISVGEQFPCKQCGAKLHFKPGTTSLVCPYCNFQNQIDVGNTDIPYLDFLTYAAQSAAGEHTHDLLHDLLLVKCVSCGAQTQLAADVTAGRCAFCGSPVVAEKESKKLIKPGALLPFAVDKAQADGLFRTWISGLWFAPSNLSQRAEHAGIDGAYIPAWTYNTQTQTQYTGQRGIDYQVPETYTEYVNGKPETRTRMVTRTQWTPVAGQVANAFRDLLVLASQSLPPKQAVHLQPWDLQKLVTYKDDYLSGLACQSYQLDLTGGFEQAKTIMLPFIRGAIERDIGGNHQRIETVDTKYDDVQFRHILLPLWISAYQYSGKAFRFLINARSGAVQGERPYSWIKIGLLVAAILIAIVLLVLIAHR